METHTEFSLEDLKEKCNLADRQTALLLLTLKGAWTNSSDGRGLWTAVCGHPNDGNVLIRSLTTTSDKQLGPTES